MLCDTPRVLVDLGREGVFLLRHVAELFDQRQVAVAFDVALGARITVPVPGATEVAAGLDDSNVLDTGFVEARAGQQSAETSTDDYYIDLVGQWSAIKRFDVRVVQIVSELAGNFDVLRVAVGANALVALLLVLLPQGVRIEIQLQISNKVRIFHFLSHLSFHRSRARFRSPSLP